MATQTAPAITKIDVLEKAKSEGVFVPKSVGRVGDVTLEIAVGKGELPFWHTNDEAEHVYCLRGSIHYQLKYGDQELPPVDVKTGELFTIPAGVAHKPICSDDNVVLIMEKINPWTTFDA